ncbi:hypothetical protein A7C99_1773 [Trichophyton rubrum]|uniref:Uncharacterized protein n=1 Tax=Trichophyton rubrum TaxID=5551 RepID=A0A178F4L5_TRIRU|nr:hypothetical protein A7C99_1773 [Trichophyton rubrum]
MPFDGDDGDARDGASPSGSAGGAVGLPALAASSLSIGSTLRQHREATWASGETTIHGRYTLAHKLRAIENLPTGLSRSGEREERPVLTIRPRPPPATE